jgi:hypothetical protein
MNKICTAFEKYIRALHLIHFLFRGANLAAAKSWNGFEQFVLSFFLSFLIEVR